MHRLLSRWGLPVVLAGLLAPAAAFADGMRCGTQLVTDGDSMYDVSTRCGTPDVMTQRRELRTVQVYVPSTCYTKHGPTPCGSYVAQTYEVTLDDWLYDFGSTEFVRTVTFEQNRVIAIKTGHYGVK